MIRAVLVDDNAALRKNLRALLTLTGEDIEVLGEASGVEEGLALVQTTQPDLIFLDVEMQDGTGFDLLARLQNKAIKVIFVTGHNAYALKAFQFSAIDYVLKPVDPDELTRALEKAKAILQPETHINNLINPQERLSRLVLSDQQFTYLVELEDIVRAESQVNYTRFFLQDGQEILVSKTLKSYEGLLSDAGFFRPHQSHLINLRFFVKLDKRDGGTLHLKNGDMLPISFRKRDDFQQALAAFAQQNL